MEVRTSAEFASEVIYCIDVKNINVQIKKHEKHVFFSLL